MAIQFKKVRDITLPLLKLQPNGPSVEIRCEGEMFVGKKVGDREAAVLMHVLDLNTSTECQIIVPTVMRKILEEEYLEKETTYVGRCFSLSLTRDPAKSYNHVNLTEIEVEGMFTPDQLADAVAEAHEIEAHADFVTDAAIEDVKPRKKK